jgi:hypothetical protein
MKTFILSAIVALGAVALIAFGGGGYNVAGQTPSGDRPISEYGWQVATEFLSDFTSLFKGVYHPEYVWDVGMQTTINTGRFMRWDTITGQFITTYEQPEISFRAGYGFLDAQGNRVIDEPWAIIRRFECQLTQDVFYSFHYANYFKLFDFDNDGIPEIFVHFNQTFEGCYDGFYRIFRYIDGGYRMLEMVAYANGEQLQWVSFGNVHELFIDPNGRIITFINSEMTGIMEYTHLVLTDTHAEFHRIISLDDISGDPWEAWEEWHNHHWNVWEHTFTDSWRLHNPTIFRTNIAITPLQPFYELGAELFALRISRNFYQ